MSKLTTDRRKSLSSMDFGLPAQRKYPMPDKSHARNAIARAAEEVKKHHITPAQQKEIDAKARRILGK